MASDFVLKPFSSRKKSNLFVNFSSIVTCKTLFILVFPLFLKKFIFSVDNTICIILY